MTVIKYSFTSLSAAAEDIETSSRTITGQLEDLKAQIKPMVSAWEGDAADGYKQHQDKWDAAAWSSLRSCPPSPVRLRTAISV